jgi:hypothetical protein
MRPRGPKAELIALRRYLKELEVHFLSGHLTATALGPPNRAEILDVGAFVVLAHGAMENFVEGVALWVLTKLVFNWTTTQRAIRCTASILLYQQPGKVEAGTVYDTLREALNLANKSASHTIQENNGISPQHLRVLFHPLGVNVPDEPILAGSLEMVVALRHHWAPISLRRHGDKVGSRRKDSCWRLPRICEAPFRSGTQRSPLACRLRGAPAIIEPCRKRRPQGFKRPEVSFSRSPTE